MNPPTTSISIFNFCYMWDCPASTERSKKAKKTPQHPNKLFWKNKENKVDYLCCLFSSDIYKLGLQFIA